jgi:prefoldin subunit 5
MPINPASNIPNPDPSEVTGRAIERAVDSSVAVINARIDEMQRAVELFQADLTRVPTAVDRAIVGLQALLEAQLTGLRSIVFEKIDKLEEVTKERFVGVGSQFSERDTRTDQRAGDTKLAVDAAFAAAKEATAKIEAGFTKQIDAMISIIDTKTENLASGLGDLKERLISIEGRTQGISAANQDHRHDTVDNRGLVFGIFGIVLGASAMLIAAADLLHR